MSKKKSPEAKRARRVAEIEALLLDVDLRKKQRKALRAELSALSGEFVPTVASGITAPAQTFQGATLTLYTDDGPIVKKGTVTLPEVTAPAEFEVHLPATDEMLTAERRAKQDAEASDHMILSTDIADPQGSVWASTGSEVHRLEEQRKLTPDQSWEQIKKGWAEMKKEETRKRRAKQDAEVATQWAHQQSLADRWRLEDPTGIASGLIIEEKPTPVAEPVMELAKATIEEMLVAPADPVLENGNGQAMIHYLDPTTGLEKVKGYTRVTTYIDGLDDKTVLTKWKMRTLLEGAAVESLSDLPEDERAISKVARSVGRTDAALADIDSREREEGELLELRRQELLREHRTLLEGIAEDLMELGGAHEKANKGTNLHRLTELVDTGHELPADTTASDRRDVEAYQAKMAELDLRVLWCERRVVLDDIQVSGTMDRAYQVLLPGMRRRIRVVGDLKTGSVDWGRGKIACQLALYARGFGYDWEKPLERERLSLSKAYGLLIHLPQGEGRCEVYVVDLELAAKGLALAAEVREWRRVQRRAYDLKSPMVKP